MPSVIVLTSRFSFSIILFVSNTSLILIIFQMSSYEKLDDKSKFRLYPVHTIKNLFPLTSDNDTNLFAEFVEVI